MVQRGHRAIRGRKAFKDPLDHKARKAFRVCRVLRANLLTRQCLMICRRKSVRFMTPVGQGRLSRQ